MTAGPAVRRVLDRLDGVRQRGGGWVARCPCHDDRDPSLRVTEGDDGRALLTCDPCGADGAEVAEAVGLPVAALFPDYDPEAPGARSPAPSAPTIGDALNSAADAGPDTLDAAVRYMCDAALAGAGDVAVAAGPAAADEAEPVELRDLLAMDLPPRRWLVGDLIQERDLAMVHAWRGVGKSRFAHGLAVAIVSGGRFLKWRAPEPKGVLIVDGELPREDLQSYLAQAVAAGTAEPAAPLRVLSADLADAPVWSLATEAGRAQVERHLDGISLVILDSITTLCTGTGNENEAESWEQMQAWLLDLRRRGITVLLVHHDGKGLKQRGTSKREDVLNLSLQLRRPSDYRTSEGARFEIHFSKARGLTGDAAMPFEAHLRPGEHGVDTWTWRTTDAAVNEQITGMRDAGMTIREISDELGMPTSTVHRRVQKATGRKQ